MSYAQSHPYPPQSWFNPYRPSDKWQSIELDRAGLALYQGSYINSYTNRNWFCSQTELVGSPIVDTPTYSDEQCKLIGENVVAPIWQAFNSIGVVVNLDNFRYHEDSSGSASEYWYGRMSDDEWFNFNGVCAHIDVPTNDHWDVGSERVDLICQYAKAFLGQGGGITPPQTSNLLELGMFLLQNDRRGIWLMSGGYARGLNEEEYNQAKAIPGIQQFNTGGNERAFDLVYSACMNGQMASES